MSIFNILTLYFAIYLAYSKVSFASAQLDDDSLPYDYYLSSPSTSRPWPSQFEMWYPDHATFLADTSRGICNLTLRDYRAAYEAPRGSTIGSKIQSICYRHEACILSQYGENVQANAQGASIVLGLIPTFLSVLGPSVSEIYLLSIHRPLLAMLISIGSPSYYVPRLLDYHAPARLLNAESDMLQISFSSRWMVPLIVFEYLATLGASALVLYTTVEMGQKTTLAWGCTTQFAPLLWAVLALVPHILVTGGYAVLSWITDSEQPARQQNRQYRENDQESVPREKPTTTLGTGLLDVFEREVTICAEQKLRRGAVERGSRLTVALHILAEWLSYVLWAFGTAVFSSLLFVTVRDVFRFIFWRLVFSAVVCRFILIIELTGLRKVKSCSAESA
ncbi:hypothetical protein GGR54DRAFT_460212 [Hypoxylon sp. NC1633]|nr:hypothetical protein GGR54DRAFT_460212 [Hypoxylon sp. NC1633]